MGPRSRSTREPCVVNRRNWPASRGPYVFRLTEAEYFSRLQALGYSLKIYQSDYVNLCRTAAAPEVCHTYDSTSLGVLPGAATIDAALAEHGAVGAIAYPLFRDFLVPFELTSILLLVAIVGAVLLAKRRI